MVREFQAIVMAGGRGSRMTEITAGRPKCTIPIGNKPMVWYPLNLLQRTGIKDAILVVMEQMKSAVQAALEPLGLKINVDIVTIADEDWGTADTLRFLSDRIKSDVIVVSCDFITDMSLHPILDLHRLHSNGVMALYFEPQPSDNTLVTPGPKSKFKPERDLVGLDEKTSRLVFVGSVSDFDSEVPISREIMEKHPVIDMYSKITDAHFYIFKKWVVDFLVHKKNISTLKGELLPYLVKKQASKRNKIDKRAEANTSAIDEDTKKDIFDFAQESYLTLKVRNISFYNDHKSDMNSAYHGDSIRCYGFLAPSHKFGARINTIVDYCNINRQIKDRWEMVTGGVQFVRVHSSADIKSTQMDDTCMVGENTTIAEKTSIKACIIGARCEIESKVRLANCILMNGVKIREGCILSNCVVCDGVEICNNAELKDCLIGSNNVISAEAKHTSEVLTVPDRLMQI
ncbi:translation initiation factor eIF2B subunit gamma isoform X2 [Periplaneta americana]|uniref:Translation initiation factor eIF2B subunit gamma n=2 Tax=Periplaneta americana TaxID=6978 RepID=A0ABQ8TVG9_PERAM|nr:hypothetical protein ANN_01533 [Periplaneta americana]